MSAVCGRARARRPSAVVTMLRGQARLARTNPRVMAPNAFPARTGGFCPLHEFLFVKTGACGVAPSPGPRRRHVRACPWRRRQPWCRRRDQAARQARRRRAHSRRERLAGMTPHSPLRRTASSTLAGSPRDAITRVLRPRPTGFIVFERPFAAMTSTSRSSQSDSNGTGRPGGTHEIAVHFVGHDAVSRSDLREAPKFFCRDVAPGRVVGAAQDEEPCGRLLRMPRSRGHGSLPGASSRKRRRDGR